MKPAENTSIAFSIKWRAKCMFGRHRHVIRCVCVLYDMYDLAEF